ncbi:hypothetical protein [Tessaracoccus coleopterorum]|uniref:hypothetical protein n=1 Tax=Tessaracoccus coleopterorum TaxID=2714950 RepID=UPI0018D4A967|nr:hypothetical protein [Tessaracoccus coleopterorum]
MPVQTSYPGVYIQEAQSGVRTITGVATSIAAFVGRADRGPTDDPVTINSYADFERIFGGLSLGSRLGYAVRDFYLNGGSQAVIVRLHHGVYGSDEERAAAVAAAKATSDATVGRPTLPPPRPRPAPRPRHTSATTSRRPRRSSPTRPPPPPAHHPWATSQRRRGPRRRPRTPRPPATPRRPRRGGRGCGGSRLPREGRHVRHRPGQDVGREGGRRGRGGQRRDGRPGDGGGQDRGVRATPLDRAVLDVGFDLVAVSPDPGATGSGPGSTTTWPGERPTCSTSPSATASPARWRATGTSRSRPATSGASTPCSPTSRGSCGSPTPPPSRQPSDGHPGLAPGDSDVWADHEPATNHKVEAAGMASDGGLLAQNDFTGPGTEAGKEGLYALSRADLFNLLCIPPYLASDDVDADLVAKAAAYCESRRALLLVDPPSTWNDKDKARDGVAAVGTNSANSALYFPRLTQPDPCAAGSSAASRPVGRWRA